MRLAKWEGVGQPLEYINLVDLPAGESGMVLQHTLSVRSANLNVIPCLGRAGGIVI